MPSELEGLLAEKARREGRTDNAPKFTMEDAANQGVPFAQNMDPQQSMAPQQKQSLLQRAQPYMQKGIDFAENYAHLPELGAGILQSFADIPISAANLALMPFDKEIPHPDFRRMLNKPKTLGGDIASGVGGVLGGYGPAVKAYGALDKFMPGKGAAGMAADVAKGLLTGFGLGETGAEGEGRAASGLIGGGLAPIAKLLPSSVAHNISEAKNKLGKHFNKAYGEIFKKAEQAGVNQIRKPQANYEYVRKHMGKDYRQSMDNFLTNPDLKSAHKFQSDLGKFIESINKSRIKAGGSLPSVKNEAEELAINMQKKIRGSMFDELSKKEPGLGKEFQKVTKQYRDKMAPYLQPDILKYQAGKLKGAQLYDALGKNNEFRSATRGQFPQFDINEALAPALKGGFNLAKDIGKYAAGTGLGGLGVYGLGKHYGLGGDGE